jgi:hypothetical protein
LLERIERLERGQAGQGVPITRHDEPPRPAPKAKRPADGARAALGGVRAQSEPPAPVEPAAPVEPPVSPASDPSPPASDDIAFPTRDALTLAWGDVVLASLAQRAKVRFGAGHFTGVDGDTATFALPNTVHRDRCEECRDEVESALAKHFGRSIPLQLVVAAPGTPPDPTPAVAKPVHEPDDEIDLTDLQDAPPAGVASPIEHVMQIFEGAEVVED